VTWTYITFSGRAWGRNWGCSFLRCGTGAATREDGSAPAGDLQLTGFYTRDYHDADQAGRSFTAAPGQAQDPDRNWWVATRDRFDTAGITLGLEGLEQYRGWLDRAAGERRVDAGLDAVYSRSRGGIGVESGPALVTEPLPADSPLWSHPRVFITPHNSGSTPHYWDRGIELLVENIRRFRNDEPMLNVVDKREGY
jgi:hypothetical protein